MNQPTKRTFLSLTILAALAFTGTAAVAEDAKPQEKEEPKTIKLSGVFESTKVHEIKLATKQLGDATVRKIVEHGASVEAGDFLVSFEKDNYDDQLQEAVRKMASSKLDRTEAEFTHKQFLETQKLDKAAAIRAWKAAQDQYRGYQEFDRQYAIDSAKFSLKQSQNSLEYLEEDLRQLKRMYKEDELTEESEELVLVRARRAVEASKFRLRNTEVRSERTLKQTLPREQASQEEQHTRAKLAYDKAMSELAIARKKKQLSREAADEAFKKETEKLDELRADSKQLLLKSPTAGLVLYGKLNRGQISDKPATLKVGSKVTKEQVFLSVVHPKRLQIRCSVPEKEIAQLKKGMQGTATPTSQPDKKLNVTISSLDRIPYAKGQFDCVLTIKGKSNELLPTMTCSIEFDPSATTASTAKAKSPGKKKAEKAKKTEKAKRKPKRKKASKDKEEK